MLIRKIAKRTALMGWLIAALSITSVPQAKAAATVFFDSVGPSGCGTSWAPNAIHTMKLIATRSVTFNTIKVAIGGGSQINFLSSRYYIYSHNPSGGSTGIGAPSSSLATFTPDAISGSGANTFATFVGSFSATSGTSYWVVPGQQGSSFPVCYWSPSATDMSMSAFRVDTSTSGSNTAWLRVSSTNTSPSGTGWTSFPATGTAFQFSLEDNVVTPVTATLGTQSGTLRTDFRTVTPLTVNVDTNSRVTFYANGRVIAGCRNILSSSGTATCNWKPSVRGSHRIYAAANPISNSYIAANTPTISVGVVARTNKR